MRFARSLILLLLVATGCGEPEEPPKPLGTFVLDAEAMTQALVELGMSEQAARRSAAAGRVRLVFDDGGTFTLVVRDSEGRVERSAGRWTREGDRVELVTTQRQGKTLDPPERVAARLDGDRLSVDLDRGGALPFQLRAE